MHINFFQYIQLLVAIPNRLKKKALENPIIDRNFVEEDGTFHLNEKSLQLTKLKCRYHYKLFQESAKTEPTAIHSWAKHFPNHTPCWKRLFQNIYKTIIDNKQTQFAFKLFHRIPVTNKELKRFKIRSNNICSQCLNVDSLEHSFSEFLISILFYQETLVWFNATNTKEIKLPNDQFLIQNYDNSFFTSQPKLRRRLHLLVLFAKRFLYTCKIKDVKPIPFLFSYMT